MPERRRLFFAVQPPLAIRTALAQTVASLDRPARRVHPDDLHLTLAFLGEVAAADAPWRAGAIAAAQAQPFALTLDRFGLWRRRGIAWAAPGAVPAALQALHSALRAALEAAGWSVDRRGFRPHVTLARNARAAPRGAVVGPWWVAELRLLESGPPPAPRYGQLAAWPLGDDAADAE